MFQFTDEQYNQFDGFMKELNTMNWGGWPDCKTWPRFEGMPGYSLNQYEQDNGKTFVVVKFDSPVRLPDERTGKRFKKGGQRAYQPVCEYF